ncbi:hypothetical protein V6N13_059043 [Hibiscus sabdariffa]
MGSGEGNPHFSVFDGVKTFPLTPEALMAEIDTAITSLEYARATALLDSPSSSLLRNKGQDSPKYDARLADEAYKAATTRIFCFKLAHICVCYSWAVLSSLDILHGWFWDLLVITFEGGKRGRNVATLAPCRGG